MMMLETPHCSSLHGNATQLEPCTVHPDHWLHAESTPCDGQPVGGMAHTGGVGTRVGARVGDDDDAIHDGASDGVEGGAGRSVGSAIEVDGPQDSEDEGCAADGAAVGDCVPTGGALAGAAVVGAVVGAEGAAEGTSEFVGKGSSCVASEGDTLGVREAVGDRECGNFVGTRVVAGRAVGLRVFSACCVGLSEGRLVALGAGLAVTAAAVGFVVAVGGFVVVVVGGFVVVVVGGFVMGGGTLTGLHTKRTQWHKLHRAHWFSLSARQPPEGLFPEYEGGPAQTPLAQAPRRSARSSSSASIGERKKEDVRCGGVGFSIHNSFNCELEPKVRLGCRRLGRANGTAICQCF